MITGATITLRQLATGETRTAHSDAAGQFAFAGLPVGRYRIDAIYRGFIALSRNLSLQPRDRAVLSATLNVGAVAESITIKAAAPMEMDEARLKDLQVTSERTLLELP